MNTIEVVSRTIEEAINEGLSKLGCSISDCRVTIVQEGAKGLLGMFGAKPAIVRLTRTDISDGKMEDLGIDMRSAFDPEPVVQPVPVKKPKVEKPAPPKPAPPKPAPPVNKMRFAERPEIIDAAKPVEFKPVEQKPVESTARVDAVMERLATNETLERFRTAPLPNAAPAKPPRPTRDRPPMRDRAPAPVNRAPVREPRPAARPVYEQEPLTRPAEPVPVPENIPMHGVETPEGVAQQYLLDVTKLMGLTIQVDVKVGDEGHLFATLYGDTLGILIGRRGDTLDALQYLTSLAVNKGREGYTRVTLDTENYRKRREEALTRLAQRMAAKATRFGQPVAMEPMNPYERRILHASLQEIPGVTTHSEGEEPNRYVVIVPDK